MKATDEEGGGQKGMGGVSETCLICEVGGIRLEGSGLKTEKTEGQGYDHGDHGWNQN